MRFYQDSPDLWRNIQYQDSRSEAPQVRTLKDLPVVSEGVRCGEGCVKEDRCSGHLASAKAIEEELARRMP